MDSKVRGWLAIIAALVAAYFAWGNRNVPVAVLILALMLLISGYHHVTSKHR